MTVLTRERLQPLLKVTPGPCVSLYMPTHRSHPGTEQDPIRFRNSLKEAERLLSDRYSSGEIRALLDPVAELASVEFWRHQSEGLAILRSRDVLEEFRLTLSLPELVVVAESFHIRPLIRSLNANVRYFVIAVSQNAVKVLEGTSTSLTQVEVPNLPENIAEHGTVRGGKGALSSHSARGGGGAHRVHAAGGAESTTQDDLAPYFRAIDRAVGSVLQQDPVPVIFAGVDYYAPIYRDVSRLKGLANSTIHGSPDAMTHEELHAKAWPIAEALLRENEERALGEYRRAAERGSSKDQLEDIVQEARGGRVRRLFLALGVRVWGTVDPTTGRVQRTDTQQGSHDDDVLDDIAQAVYLHGGEVITLSRDRMPNRQEVAAELR